MEGEDSVQDPQENIIGGIRTTMMVNFGMLFPGCLESTTRPMCLPQRWQTQRKCEG